MPDQESLRDGAIRENASARQRWELFSSHRARQMAHLMRGESGGKLAVFGAGNTNDLDLAELAAFYGEVHLFDLDERALQAALEQQPAANRERIVLHGGVEVTGVLPELERWRGEAPEQGEFRRVVAAAENPPDLGLGNTFDVATSTTLLSQLISSAEKAVGGKRKQFADLAVALRLGHFRFLLNCVRPGGVVIAFIDCVSSETAPALTTLEGEALQNYLTKLISERNFFTGTNPVAVMKMLRKTPDLAAAIEQSQLVQPWVWNFGPRSYGVYAVKIRKTA